MWFFGLIVVLLIGAVAVVASGRWGGMSTAYDDRPDMSVPARQALTAADLETARFGVGLRGYRMDEVDTLLERVAREVAERDRRIADLERAVTPILHGPEGAGFTSRSEYAAADFDDTGFQKPILVGGDFPEPTPDPVSPESPAAEPAVADPAPAQAEAVAAEPAAAESAPATDQGVPVEPARTDALTTDALSPEPTSPEPTTAEPATAEITAVDQPAVPADPAVAEPAQASAPAADTASASAAPSGTAPASAAAAVPASEVGAAEAAPQPVAEREQPAAPVQQAGGEGEPQPMADEREQQDEREHEVGSVLDDQPEPPAQVALPPLLQELVHTNYDDEPEPEPWFQAKEPPPDHNSVQAPNAAEDEPGVNGDETTRGRHSSAPDVNVPQRPN
ncbi:DivIVA domain-containing protein [Kribbella qitaiheensis]|uniref:DivIVA domain-containing protein n=1 Tax=Kribbella qitaiheensis TaxID=1544730 RepID=UPI00362111CE